MKILGIDPGAATGLVIWDTETQIITAIEETQKGVQGFKPAFQFFLTHLQPDTVICESFVLRNNEFQANLEGVEIIGWLKGEQLVNFFVTPPTHQTFNKLGEKAPKAKSPVTKLMKQAGVPIGKGHTRMALSTAIWLACTNLKDSDTIRTHQALTKESK